MNNLDILANAFEYIEQHLREDIKTEDVAAACYCSKSKLEKIFRYINHNGVHHYIVRRRMMVAAKMIVANSETGLLEVALSCGYSTNESFTRAFRSVWNCNPSDFRSNDHFTELYPRRYPPRQDGGIFNMRVNLDISELYETFRQRKDCYFVCCDIKRLVPINEISHKAGDLAILESLKRMQEAAGDEDIVFRIGGDEFVMLTNSEDIKYAEDVMERIRSYNGQPIVFEDKEIPLSLHIAVVKFEGDKNIKYRDLFEQLHTAILESRK